MEPKRRASGDVPEVEVSAVRGEKSGVGDHRFSDEGQEREARQHAVTFGSACSCSDAGLFVIRPCTLLIRYKARQGHGSKFRSVLGRTHVKQFGSTAVFGGLTSMYSPAMIRSSAHMP